MPSDKVYKVFLSSTYEDLREERAAVQKALLQLNCLPVGMELFPAADEETWSFIKSQIDDSDYYVVVVAGRYGSLAPGGLSYTEMEYDYAISRKKPAIAFIHREPGTIAAQQTEQTDEGKEMLRKFISKLKRRLIQYFDNPHELALVVTQSFVRLLNERPAIGYVRSDAAVDFKTYATILEANKQLKEHLGALEAQPKLVIDQGEFSGTLATHSNGQRARYYFVQVRNLLRSQPVHEAELLLIRIEKEGVGTLFDEFMPLTWVRQELYPTRSRVIGPDQTASLFFIQQDGLLGLTPSLAPGGVLATHFPLFHPGAVTLWITLQATSTETDSPLVRLKIAWNGLWSDDKTNLAANCVVSVDPS